MIIRWLGAKIERPIDYSRLILAVAAFLLAAAFLVSAVTTRNQLADQSSCANERSRLSTAVTEAQADFIIALGDLMSRLGRRETGVDILAPLRELDPHVESSAASRLQRAVDERQLFEQRGC